jgi:hypothetical protein
MMRRALLINERDVRLGTVDVSPAIFVIRYGGATFVRTGEAVKLRLAHRATVDVFAQAEVYVRDKLEPIP